ncbi:MAG: ribonuclease Z [Desulfobacterales bacterium]
MPATLRPRLVNGPFGDPALYVACRHQSRAFLFDCGDLAALTPGDILKLNHIFISHTHMDHFCGFDRILRLLLGRDKILRMVGPAGFLSNLEGKLEAYTWNLVGNYEAGLTIEAMEIDAHKCRTRRYDCRAGFKPRGPDQVAAFDGVLAREPAFTFSGQVLDHHVPCLGFALKERFRVNIITQGLRSLNLIPGPWLQEFKSALYRQDDPEGTFTIPPAATREQQPRRVPLKSLTVKISRITPGMKIAYIVDAAWTPVNVARMVALARNADHLYIEAAFAHRHLATARAKAHLTARQAGLVAAWAAARRLTPIHFSPRYSGAHEALVEEAQAAFRKHFQHPRGKYALTAAGHGSAQ